MKQRGYPNGGVLDMEYAETVHAYHEAIFSRRPGTLIVDETAREQSLERKMTAVSRYIREGLWRTGDIYVADAVGALYKHRLGI